MAQPWTLPGWSARERMLDGVVDEHLGAEPAPVDAVGGDAAVGEFHDLADVDLVTFRRGSQVLPRQGVTVPQVAPVAVPADELVGPAPSSFGKESAQLGLAAQDPAGAVEDAGHEGALQHGIVAVKLEQPSHVERMGSAVPLVEDELGLFTAGLRPGVAAHW